MSVTFSFDRDFQVGILALMSQRLDFLLLAVDVIEPSYFENKIFMWFYHVMKDYHAKYNACVSPTVLANEMLKACKAKIVKDTEYAEYVKVLKKMQEPVQTQRYVMDEVVKFCRLQAGKKFFLESAGKMQFAGDDDWHQFINDFSKVGNIGVNYLDKGDWYFKEAQDRCMKRQQLYNGKLSQTGIRGVSPRDGYDLDLDELIGGGLQEGQVGLWIGGSGKGKSIALDHLGKHAILSGQKVLHYTFELQSSIIAARYDAAFCDIAFKELRQRDAEVIDIIEDLSTTKGCADRLLIKFFPGKSTTVNGLRQHINQLASTGWVPDVILIDYLDLIKATTNYKDAYQDLGHIMAELCGLAGELRIPIWTATQTNKAGWITEIVDNEHVSDSAQKVFYADVIITLNMTNDEKTANTARLFISKNRNGPDKIEIEINTDYSKMILYKGPATWAGPSSKKKKKVETEE